MIRTKHTPFFLLVFVFVSCGGGRKPVVIDTYEPQAPAFCEDSAYAYIATQCLFGPRTMNSPAHDSCGNWIARKFAEFGMSICDQYADGTLYDGTLIHMRNIIASFRPEADERIIVSGHWDSRPWADNDDDEANHQTPIDGANDGASSIGVMLEMARQIFLVTASGQAGAAGPDTLMASVRPLSPTLGVDFICWDAEDSGTHGTDSSDTWCLGSQYWAGTRHQQDYRAKYGINLDMVGSARTVFYKEGYSLLYAPVVVDRVWSLAQRLGYGNYFKNEGCGSMIDDHLSVNRGGIPCIDIIGIDAEEDGFPATWHTLDDNLQHIHKPTLKAVGQTMLELIWSE